MAEGIYLKTRYGTRVEFIELLEDYVLILFNAKPVRVLIEDFNDDSQIIINKFKEAKVI